MIENQQSIVARLFANFIVHAENSRISCYDDPETKVLIGGGTGFVGTELTKTLKAKGYKPVIVSRRSGDSQITYGDLEQYGIPKNTKAVVNLAGQNVLDYFHRWTDDFKAEVYNSRIGTAELWKNLIMKSKLQHRPKVFIQISGIGYYPPQADNIYNEDSVVDSAQRDYFSHLVVDWEAAATLPLDVDVRSVFIRPGVVLGRRGGMIKQIFLPFYMGAGGRMASGTQPMSWIHLKDLCGIICHAIEKEEVSGVLNAVAPQIITNQEFVKAFATALNRPAFIPMPEMVFNIAFGQERATMITKGQKVQPRRTLESGYKFLYPTIAKACEEFSFLLYTD